MKDFKKSFSYSIFFMAIITALFTFLLAGLNYITSDAIEYNEATDLRRTILYVFDIDLPSQDPEVVEETFNEYVESEEIEDKTIYYVREDDQITAYAFPVEGVAVWGSLRAYAAVSSDHGELLGVDFVSHNETPGLGGRITEEWFKEQFRGLDLMEPEDKKYVIYRPAPDGNVDAISGATGTSNAVSDILNEGIYEFINNGYGVMTE